MSKFTEFFKNNASTILTVGGVTLSVGANVASGIATAKFMEKKEHLKNMIAEAREFNDKKILAKAYAKAGLEVAKYYAIPTALCVGSNACFIGCNKVYSNKLAAASAAYTTLSTAVSGYRARVKNAVGDDKELELWTDGKTVETKKEQVDDKGEYTEVNGVKVEASQTTFDRLFGDGYNPYWSKDGRANLAHLQATEGNVNAILRGRAHNGKPGFISVNEVFRILGNLDSSTAEGQVMGWIYNPSDERYSDTYISLGYSDTPENRNRIENLKASWNSEVWVSLIPPHLVVNNDMPHEKKVNKEVVLKNRSKLKG